MRISKKRLYQKALASLLVVSSAPVYSTVATYTWNVSNASTDFYWTDHNNWTSAPVTNSFPQLPGDTAILITGFNVYLDNSYLIPLNKIQFSGSSLYISGSAQIQLTGNNPVMLALAANTVNLNNGSILFYSNANSNSSNITPLTYNISTDAYVSFFDTATAGNNNSLFALTDNGTLNFNNNADTTFNGQISGAGVVNVSLAASTTKLTMAPSTPASSYDGPFNILLGEVTDSNDSGLPQNADYVLSPASILTINHKESIGSIAGDGNVDVVNALTLTNANNTNFSGLLSGSGSINKNVSSTGVFTLSGTGNTYNGTFTLDGGTLQAGAVGAFPSGSSVILHTSGAVLDLNGYNNTLFDLQGPATGTTIALGDGTLTLNGLSANPVYSSIYGTGGINITDGTLFLYSNTNTYSGPTTLTGMGNLFAHIDNAFSPNSDVVLNGNASTVMHLNSNDNAIGSLSGTGGLVIITQNGSKGNTLTVNQTKDTIYAGTIEGAIATSTLLKKGAGILSIAGNSAGFTGSNGGTLNIADGTIQIGTAGALPSASPWGCIMSPNATLDLSGNSNAVAYLSGDGGLVALGNALLTIVGTQSATFSGSITGVGGSLDVLGTGTTFTLGGNNTYSGGTAVGTGATLQAGDINSFSPSSDFTVNGTLDLNQYDNTIGSLNGNGKVLNTGTLTLADDQDGTFTGVFTGGSGGLIKQGVGTFHLNSTSANSLGTIQVQNGKLALGTANILSSTTPVVVSKFATFDIGSNPTTIGPLAGAGTVSIGATLTITNSEPTTFAGQIIGAGGITLTNSPAFTLSGTNTYSGATTLTGATLDAGATNSFSPGSVVNMTNGNLYLNNYDNTIGGLSGSGSVVMGTGSLTIGSKTNTSFSGIISGRGGVTYTGANVLTLNGANTYTGGTSITGSGTLALGASGSLAPTSALTIGSAGTFDMSLAASQTVGDLSGSGSVKLGSNTLTAGTANSTIYNGVISGPGNFVKAGTGILTLGGANTYTGTTTVSGGTLRAGGSGVLPSGSDVTLDAFATLDLNNHNNTIGSLSGAGGFVTLGSGYLTLSDNSSTTFGGIISGTGGITKQGSGTFTITGPNTYTGLTTISGGTLVSVDGSLPVDSDTLNNSSLVFNQTSSGVSANYNGSISGSGSVTVAGPGIINWNGVNTYTGGTTVNAGSTVVGNTNNLQGAIANSGTVSFSQAFDGTFNGAIAGTGTIVKNGTGQLNFTTNQFAGNTFINQGILALNASLGGNVFVNHCGKLKGNGTILGNLTVNHGGIIAPGNSIGTINVAGNYTHNQGGIYEVQIDDMGHSSLINVGGAAILNGGTVCVIPVDGYFSVKHRYVIVNTQGGVGGSYDMAIGPDLVTGGQVFIPELIYTPTQVLLDIVPAIFDCTSNICTFNQQQIAKEIDSIGFLTNIPADLLLILNTLVNTPANLICPLLDTLTGEQYASNFITTEVINRQFLRRLYDPIRYLVASNPCYSICSPCSAVEVWLEGSGGKIYSKGHPGFHGFRQEGYEVTGGAQGTFKNLITVGMAVSYEYDNVTFRNRGSARTHTYFGGVYGLYRGPELYALADVAYGHSDQKMKRPIHFGPFDFTATGKPNISEVMTYAEVGADYALCNALIQPFVGLEYDYFSRAGFDERGAEEFNLLFASKNYDNFFSRVGLHITNAIGNGDTSNWEFSADLAWQFRLTSQRYDMTERFAFSGPFSIFGNPMVRNSLDGALTVTRVMNDQIRAYVQASGQAWRHLSAYSILAGIEASW